MRLPTPQSRALSSGGTSELAIYRAVRRTLEARAAVTGTLVDIGCGRGDLREFLPPSIRYIGVDIHRYESFASSATFVETNLNASPFPIETGRADVAVAVETIEHLENPRALFREMHRIVKPRGLVIVTTPNQSSLLSKATFLVKNQFNAFQENSYPAHITALLEIDLIRIARETGLEDARIAYTDSGRMPFTDRHWPSCCKGRLFSDNLLLSAIRA